MKNLVITIAFSCFLVSIALGQKAVLHVKLNHCSAQLYYAYIAGKPGKHSFEVPLKDGRNAGYSFSLTHPEFVKVYLSASDKRDSKKINYIFYLSPGDDLELIADFDQPEFNVKVTGKGSNNNQPLIGQIAPTDLENFYGDTLPARIINVVNADKRSEEIILDKYIKLYKPAPSFIRDWHTNLNYMTIALFYGFKENNKFRIREPYKRNYDQWQKVADSLFATAKLNDSDASLVAFYHKTILNEFLMREKERLWDEAYYHPEAFYREWYNTDTAAGKKILKADPENLVQEKVINKYFTGRSAEYLYAVLLGNAANESDPINIPEIFGRFKSRYPNSEYVAEFAPFVDAIIAKQKKPLDEKMIFMADNGTKFNSLSEVLAAMKGKTVLVDMWGTWCGPCREEMEKNTAAIHEHFKDKGLTYLYIANHDMESEGKWKSLITYFNLEGVHLLANKGLTNDIMEKVKGDGLPTVFIIKKDGTYELSKAGYPMKREVLIAQLEEDLAK